MLSALLEVNDKTEYIINKIVRHRGRSRHYYYLVHWVQYNESKDMWLLESELSSAPDVLN